MKKSLLLLSTAALTIAANAGQVEPQLLTGYAITAISPNGQWGVSQIYGDVSLINLQTGQEVASFIHDDEVGIYYLPGFNNTLSNDGLLLCTDHTNSNATYYYQGNWYTLSTGEYVNSNSSANGITPDGSRICGNLGIGSFAEDWALMVAPVIWDRQDDGSYGDYVILPHPETDVFGASPQYITATAISEDGHTIAGQIVDARGAFVYPIIYIEDENGNWTYDLPTKDLINPEGYELPDYPGEGPDYPSASQYMSEDKAAEYEEALNDYYNGVETEMPVAEDYMTEEELEAYEAAVDEYYEWEDLAYAYDDAYYAITETSFNLEFNQVSLSADGTKLGVCQYTEIFIPGYRIPQPAFYPWVFNLDGSSEPETYDTASMYISGFADNYLLAAEFDEDIMCYNGYLLKDGEVTSLYDYLAAQGDDIKSWVDLNLSHDWEIEDSETGDIDTETIMYTGMPSASSDMNVIVSWTQSAWGNYEPESYIFYLGSEDSGIAAVTADGNSLVSLDEEGNLSVSADIVDLAIYDLSGVCVKHVTNPAGTVACDLANGVYVVKTIDADGAVVATKVVK